MDKRTAVLTLTERLRKAGYVNLIIDPSVEAYLLNTTKHKVLDSRKGRIRSFYVSSIELGEFEKEIVPHTPYQLEHMFPQANYFFVKGGSKSEYGDTWRNAVVTPAALIGEVEEQVFREKFYKNVPGEILKAFEVLQVPNFIEAYNVYSSLKGDEAHIFELGIYRPFKKDDKIGIGDIIQGSSSKRYYLVDKIKSSGGIEGYRFQDEALKKLAKGTNKDEVYGECGGGYIIPVKKRLSDINFFDFVFSLPYEDQNMEVNKAVLKSLNDVDSCRILQKEYSNGKHFEDYFQVLNDETKKKVVENIKALPNQNKFLNSWLFNQGFHLDIDYLELYRKDTQGFINYFKRSDQHVQELIISDLFNCEDANKEVIEFLEKNYSSLLRDVSFKNELPPPT